jgi:hypothetical protein
MNRLKTNDITARRLKFIHSYVDRHGHPRHYFRRKGHARVALPGGYGSPEFLDAYWRYVKDPGALSQPRAASLFVREKPPKGEWVYFLRVGDRIKIGRSTTPGGRISSLKTGLPMKIDAFVVVRGSPADEKRLHVFLNRFRVEGEWFKAAEPVIGTMMRCLRFAKVVLDQ